MRYCSLGHANADGTDFCTSCGQQLLAQAPPPQNPSPPVQPTFPPVQPANPWGAPGPQIGGWQPPPQASPPPPSNSNRWWIIGAIGVGVVVLLVGVFVLTQGNSNSTDRSATTPTSQPDNGLTPEPGGQDLFQSDGERIRELLESQDVYVSASNSSLEDLADTVCEALDNGTSSGLLVSVAMDNGFTRDEATSLVAASIIVKCPWES